MVCLNLLPGQMSVGWPPIHNSIYQSQWFLEEVRKARHDRDNDPLLKQLGDTPKLKGNSFCGKMIEDLMKHSKNDFHNP